ncbi:MAG TPA: fatty acid desaturase [Bacteroidales bacterium]|nr:fatty acid desaturase [Bacteroidales bacterium]
MRKEQGIGENSNRDWITVISGYNRPELLKSWWQIINSVGPYIILWIVMIKTINIGWWLTLILAVPAAGFMVRIFIIFHDCGHGSFFKSQKMNKLIGIITGIIVFTPYHKWHRDHKIHHQTVGNLDKRGIGDVNTLTVEEYSSLSGWKKISYRFYRNPLFLFGIAPILLFTLQHRFTKSYMSGWEKAYVHLTSLALIAIVSGLILLMGWKTFLMIQLPILYIATVHGVWLFYVQHQYRDVLWEDETAWDYKTTALHGSSWFKLPAVLNWFTGNIGYHHIHHLSPMVPNYNLKKCHFENTIFHSVRPITFFSAFESLLLRLYDVKNKRMIRFSEI